MDIFGIEIPTSKPESYIQQGFPRVSKGGHAKWTSLPVRKANFPKVAKFCWLGEIGILGGEALSLRNIAKAMNNPTARRQIIELTRLPDMTRGRRAAAYVNAIMEAKDEDV